MLSTELNRELEEREAKRDGGNLLVNGGMLVDNIS